MKTIKIKLNSVYFPPVVDVEISELRRVIKENKKELMSAFLLEDFIKQMDKLNKLPFVERMIGKDFWVSLSDGTKEKFTWSNNKWDNDRLLNNNVFFTESDCDKEIARRKALGRIMSYIRDNEIELVKDEDWKNFNMLKWQIDGWDYVDDTLYTDSSNSSNWSQFSLAFYSQEDREKVISNNAKDLEILLKK